MTITLEKHEAEILLQLLDLLSRAHQSAYLSPEHELRVCELGARLHYLFPVSLLPLAPKL